MGAVSSIHGYGHWPIGKYKLFFGASCGFTRPQMGSVWAWSLKRITEIGRDGDMYWMLKRNWFQDNLVLAKDMIMVVL